jgi:GDP-D-mannose dehydratase
MEQTRRRKMKRALITGITGQDGSEYAALSPPANVAVVGHDFKQDGQERTLRDTGHRPPVSGAAAT